MPSDTPEGKIAHSPIPDTYSILVDAAALRKLAAAVRADCVAAKSERILIQAKGLIDLTRALDGAAIIIDRLVLALEEGDRSLIVEF